MEHDDCTGPCTQCGGTGCDDHGGPCPECDGTGDDGLMPERM